jgi:hypothetical protein
MQPGDSHSRDWAASVRTTEMLCGSLACLFQSQRLCDKRAGCLGTCTRNGQACYAAVYDAVNPRFSGQNSSVLPRYSPVDMSVLPRNSLDEMSCICTS